MQGGPPQVAAGVREGDVIAGKYRVDKILGMGGMGVVVAARHLHLDERVALKFLLPEALGNPEAAARFIREARAAVKIKSEHVARVSDVGTLENGSPYMVMEYLEGSDLSGWLRDKGPLPVEQAVEFVLQACVAVADAHALGIIHRDLKPANLFCIRRSDGQLSIKVLDFGISKLTDLTGTGPGMAMTKTSALMGSPLYMSPEQMRSSRDVDATADIWALGIILCELVTGRTAFLADSVTELAIRVANEPPQSIRALRPDAPPGLEAVVFKCLEKDRQRRYRNVAELALALLPFAPRRAKASVDRITGIIHAGGLSSSTSDLAGPPSVSFDATALAQGGPVPAGTLPPIGRTTMQSVTGGRPAVFGAVIVGVLLLGGGATFLALSRKPPVPDNPPASAAATPPPAAPTVAQALPTAETLKPVDAPKPADSVAAAIPAPAPAPPQPAAAAPHAAPAPRPTPARVSPPAPQAPAAAAKANCDPPYYFDARGNRTFKPECL